MAEDMYFEEDEGEGEDEPRWNRESEIKRHAIGEEEAFRGRHDPVICESRLMVMG